MSKRLQTFESDEIIVRLRPGLPPEPGDHPAASPGGVAAPRGQAAP